MSLLETILPPKELLSAEDLIAAGLYDNKSQIERAILHGLPGLRLSYRCIKFPRGALLQWLETQRTSSKKKSPKKTPETSTEYVWEGKIHETEN